MIRPRKGHNGVTFLMPSKDTMKNIATLLKSYQDEKAIDILMCHIIHDYLPTAQDWNSKRSDIPNGKNMKVEIKSASGQHVVLANGAELELDSKFKTYAFKGDVQAVWRVVKGEIKPEDFTKRASFEHARATGPGQHRPPVNGGAAKDLSRRLIERFVSAICSAEKPCCNPLYSIATYVAEEALKDESNAAMLRQMYSHNIIVTLLCVANDTYPFAHIVHDFFAQPRKEYTKYDYIKILKRIHPDNTVVGGGDDDDQDDDLISSISAVTRLIERKVDECRSSLESKYPGSQLLTRDQHIAINISHFIVSHAICDFVQERSLGQKASRKDVEDAVNLANDFISGGVGVLSNKPYYNNSMLISLVHSLKDIADSVGGFPLIVDADAYQKIKNVLNYLPGEDSAADAVSRMSDSSKREMYEALKKALEM
jgi:hypothetical protein